MGLRALLRRRREPSADAPSEEGAQRCFERRWRRGAGAASTPCLGRTAPWTAPNRGSPRAWASAPCSGGGASSQPTLPASIFNKLSLRQFLFRANDVEIYNILSAQRMEERRRRGQTIIRDTLTMSNVVCWTENDDIQV